MRRSRALAFLAAVLAQVIYAFRLKYAGAGGVKPDASGLKCDFSG